MSKVVADISVSLDGYVAGPNQTLEEPLGKGGEELHEWVLPLKSWREPHGLEGGDTGPDDDLMKEGTERTGAVVMGRRMFSSGSGPWEDDPKADGWWGDDPPFHAPTFIVTHHARDTVEKQGGTTFIFVTEGVEAAIDRARAAAGEKDVAIAGGASVIQQALKSGQLDEIQLHVAPVLLGGGVRLFEGLAPDDAKFTLARVVESPAVTHIRYEVARWRRDPATPTRR